MTIQLIRAALSTPSCYIGLVSSRSKRFSFLKRLQQEEGIGEEELTRLYTPVSLDIGARSPAEIAISITANLFRRGAAMVCAFMLFAAGASRRMRRIKQLLPLQNEPVLLFA